MDKKSKILLWVLILATVLSVSFTYYRFFVSKSYNIYTQVSCDPGKEVCYHATDCPQDLIDCTKPETTYYKILKIKAFNLSYCNHNIEDCPEPVCKDGEDCAYIKCDPSIEVGAQACGDNIN